MNNDILEECGIRESGSSAGGETWNSLRKEEETFRLVCLYGVRMRERGAVSSGYVSVVYRFLEIEVSILRRYNFESERRITSQQKGDSPVLITQSPSSLTRTQELASSNSKSWSSSILLANSGSCFKLRFRLRASQSGRGRAVDEPETVYTGTAE